MGRIVLVTGGARSGKSRFAEELITGFGPDIAYIATARVLDEEMVDRVARHRLQRPAIWRTFEAPEQPSTVVAAEGHRHDGLLLDCLTCGSRSRSSRHRSAIRASSSGSRVRRPSAITTRSRSTRRT